MTQDTSPVPDAVPGSEGEDHPATPESWQQLGQVAGQAAGQAVADMLHGASQVVEAVEASLTQRGTPEFARTSLGLFSAGFSTFALIYCVQPLLPVFAAHFAVSASESSLPLSLTTLTLALAMLVASPVSEAFGRKPLMVISVFLSSVLTLVAAIVPEWSQLLLVRALTGLTVSGLPAVAMAYLAEEMDPKAIGLAMGLYIGGNGLGGMAGRLLTGLLTDYLGWRPALAAIGVAGLISGLVCWRILPNSRHFKRRPLVVGQLPASFAIHYRDPALPLLFIEGALVMGTFITIYNYIGFRLQAPPFSLSQTVVGLIFSVYLVGIFSSAWMGDLAGRLGRRRVLWTAFAMMLVGALLTLSQSLLVIVPGVALITAGFFGGHSIASSWVGARVRQGKAQAAALYLCSYYMGGSVIGTVGGTFWEWGHWPGVVAMDVTLLVVALVVAGYLSRMQPLPKNP